MKTHLGLAIAIALSAGCMTDQDESLDDVTTDSIDQEVISGRWYDVCWGSVRFYGDNGGVKTFHSGHDWYQRSQYWVNKGDGFYWYSSGFDNHGNDGMLRVASLC